MEHIGISVIVPIYNTKPYLKECVDSILCAHTNNTWYKFIVNVFFVE